MNELEKVYSAKNSGKKGYSGSKDRQQITYSSESDITKIVEEIENEKIENFLNNLDKKNSNLKELYTVKEVEGDKELSIIPEKIKETLKNVDPWKRIPTNVPGLFLVKTPRNRYNPDGTIMIEINPADEKGNPTKRRGLYIQNQYQVEKFQEIINNQKTIELAKTIDELQGNKKESKSIPVLKL